MCVWDPPVWGSCQSFVPENDQTFFCQSPVQLLGAKFCFLSFRNDSLFHPNRCFIRTCLWYGSLWFQGILTIPLVCGKPSLETPFAVQTYFLYIYQLHPLFRYRFYPPQSLFFDCFCHTYCHFPILGENRHKSLHITHSVFKSECFFKTLELSAC